MKKEIFNRYATEVAKEFHLTLDEMFEGTRSRECVDARFLLYYLCMERPIRVSYIQRFMEEEGHTICHSTIIHGYKRAKKIIESDKDFCNVANNIQEGICTP